MASHRSEGRPGLLERLGLHRPRPVVPAQRRLPGIELVHAHTKLTHLVSDDALVEGSRAGRCWAMCGEFVLVGSMMDPGRGRCGKCFA